MHTRGKSGQDYPNLATLDCPVRESAIALDLINSVPYALVGPREDKAPRGPFSLADLLESRLRTFLPPRHMLLAWYNEGAASELDGGLQKGGSYAKTILEPSGTRATESVSL